VAIETQLRFTACQQRGGVRGSVRVVTFKTALFGGLMNYSGLLDSLLDLPMALETQLFPRGEQEIPILAGVRVVAVSAASCCDHRMHTCYTIGQQIVVALKADLLGLRIQEAPMVGSVRVVTL
jgi:hypothetical protein